MQRLVVALAVLVSAGVTALVVAATGGAQGATAQTITLIARDAPGKYSTDIDVPPRRRLNTGDSFVFAEALYDETNRVRKGVDAISCTVAGRRVLCSGSLNLRFGQIAVMGTSGETPDFSIAVVGGTGVFAGARGTMRVHDQHGTTKLTVTLLR